jgi:Bacterial SH3 domain
MRQSGFAFIAFVLLGSPALGAAGDVLVVTGNDVNVRAGPGRDQSVIRQVDGDQRLIEIEREGDWVHAEIVGSESARGWVHNSLVAPEAPAAPEAAEPAAPPAEETGDGEAPVAPQGDAARPAEDVSAPLPEAATEPPAEAIAPETEGGDLQRFRDSVDYLNSRAQAVAGADLFTEVEPLGGGVVQVGATDAWASMPPAGQQSYANTLLDRWAAAIGRADQVKVQIVDASGQVLMEESKP